jgi:uncharacterized membrane protein
MLKKIAMIILVAAVIMIALVFMLPLMAGVDASAVNGTVYEDTYDQVMDTSNLSYRLMQFTPLFLAVGGCVLVAGAFLLRKKGRGSRRPYRGRRF